MIEHEIRKKGLIQAPGALDAAVLRYARKNVAEPLDWLDNALLVRIAGYVPLLDWALIAAALLSGKRMRITPIVPGLVPFMPGLTIGDTK